MDDDENIEGYKNKIEEILKISKNKSITRN